MKNLAALLLLSLAACASTVNTESCLNNALHPSLKQICSGNEEKTLVWVGLDDNDADRTEILTILSIPKAARGSKFLIEANGPQIREILSLDGVDYIQPGYRRTTDKSLKSLPYTNPEKEISK
jgi:hypothetical protein